MSPRIPKKPNRRALDFPEPDQSPSLPPDSATTVLLKTLMDLKQSFGQLQSDLETLKESVNEVKTKQKEIDGTLRDVKTIFKTIVKAISAIVALLGLIKFWPVIQGFLNSLNQAGG